MFYQPITSLDQTSPNYSCLIKLIQYLFICDAMYPFDLKHSFVTQHYKGFYLLSFCSIYCLYFTFSLLT